MKKKTRSTKQGMVDNNKLARTWLVKNGFEEVWLKPHPKYPDIVWKKLVNDDTKQVLKYHARDIWNHFDGMCWRDGILYFLAVSDRWKGIDEIKEFISTKRSVNVIVIKVHPKTKQVMCKEFWN
jgi:hypothetical protein